MILTIFKANFERDPLEAIENTHYLMLFCVPLVTLNETTGSYLTERLLICHWNPKWVQQH